MTCLSANPVRDTSAPVATSKVMVRLSGRFCASDFTVHAMAAGGPKRSGAPGGLTQTGCGSFSASALRTISPSATNGTPAACIFIMASWSCSAWGAAAPVFQSCAPCTSPSSVRAKRNASPQTLAQGKPVVSNTSASPDTQNPVTACKSRKSARCPRCSRGQTTPANPCPRGHHI